MKDAFLCVKAFTESVEYDFELNRNIYFLEGSKENLNKKIPSEIQRMEYLRSRGKTLRMMLRDRPKDRRAMTHLAEVMYEQKDFISATNIINKVFACGENSGDLHMKLARCFLHKWFVDGKRSNEGDKCYYSFSYSSM